MYTSIPTVQFHDLGVPVGNSMDEKSVTFPPNTAYTLRA